MSNQVETSSQVERNSKQLQNNGTNKTKRKLFKDKRENHSNRNVNKT